MTDVVDESCIQLPTEGKPNDLSSIMSAEPSLDTGESEPPAESQPEAPPLSAEDKKKRRNYLYKIRQYLLKFPDALTEYNMSDVENEYDLEQLQGILDDMKFKVGACNSEKLYKGLYFTGVNVVEKIGCEYGLQIDGLSMALHANPEVDLTLSEIAIDYSDYIYTDPMYRLCFTTLQTAYALHNMRKTDSAPRSVPPGVQNKYEDL